MPQQLPQIAILPTRYPDPRKVDLSPTNPLDLGAGIVMHIPTVTTITDGQIPLEIEGPCENDCLNLAPGEYTVFVGASSDNTPLTGLFGSAEVLHPPEEDHLSELRNGSERALAPAFQKILRPREKWLLF